MTLNQIREYIDANGGTREYLINWEWAYFTSNEQGRAVFAHVKDHCDHRGFHDVQSDSNNPNLRKAAFRFR